MIDRGRRWLRGIGALGLLTLGLVGCGEAATDTTANPDTGTNPCAELSDNSAETGGTGGLNSGGTSPGSGASGENGTGLATDEGGTGDMTGGTSDTTGGIDESGAPGGPASSVGGAAGTGSGGMTTGGSGAERGVPNGNDSTNGSIDCLTPTP